MHRAINDILSSTERRVHELPSIESEKIIAARRLDSSISHAKDMGSIPVIAEVKPASPTTFNRDVTPKEAAVIARTMEDAGAAGISVLTEPDFFKGSLENLEYVRKAVNVPVLRKDFIIDIRQIHEVESDMILLIAGILGERLPEFVDRAQQIGLQPLVEVHNEAEMESALKTQARIIGINNRNLNTMAVDLKTTKRLAPMIKDHDDGRIVISESGISTPEDVRQVMRAGADAILVGTSIMKGDVFRNTRRLVKASL